MKDTRTLALRREQLAELTPDQLIDAVAAQGVELTVKGACGNTADSFCTIRFTIDCE